MSETPAPAVVPPPAPGTPWYEGKADAETIGTWQNKGWKLDDPAAIALESTKAYREAQKFIGAPPDRLLKLPEKTDDDAGWNAVYQRLGAPADAKDYDFSAIKHADGSDPDAKLLDAARSVAAALRAPKDKAPEIAKAVVKHLDDAKAEQSAVSAGKLAEERAKLAQSWGLNAKANELQAMQGAKRLGITPEAVAALEGQIGYAGVMEAMRKIGALGAEDPFVEGAGNGGTPATREAATARYNELQADPAWGKRLISGDAATKREFDALMAQIAA